MNTYSTQEVIQLIAILRSNYGPTWTDVTRPLYTAPIYDWCQEATTALLMDDGTSLLKALCDGLYNVPVDKTPSAWDITQCPYDQIPLYINHQRYYIRLYAQWRLQIGR